MAKNARLVRDDAYEEMAATYQVVQMAVLNDILKDCGIKQKKVRRRICEQFAFGMGNFHDQYWFKVNGKKVYPLLCFSKKFLNVDTKIDELGTVFAPSSGFAFHEYAFGDAVSYFDENKEIASDIEMGPVGE